MATDTTIEIYRGDDIAWTLTFTQNGSPLVLTGCSIFFTAKTNKDDLDADAVLKQKHTVGTNTTGIYTFEIEHTVTDLVPVGTYFYDFQLVDTASPVNVTTLGEGKLKVLQDVTTTITTYP